MTGLIAHTYGALSKLESSMRSLERAGLGPATEPYQILSRARRAIWESVGIRQPKLTQLLLQIIGLSPGTIRVFHDAETGWFTEAREKPGDPPIYHQVSDVVAAQILKGKLTHELEAELMTPDEYLGE